MTNKLYLVGQTPWWSTGAKAGAAAAFDVHKTALYELDLATNKLALVWDVPANAVQPASTKVLHGVSVHACGASCSVDITVSTGKTTILVLTAYNALNWRISVSPGTTLEKVIVRSYMANTLEGTGSAVIDNQLSSSLYGDEGVGVTRLRYVTENMLGITMSTFQAAYDQPAFTVQ